MRDAPPARAIVETPLPPVRAPLWNRALPWAIAAATRVMALWLWAPWRAASASTAAALRLTPVSFEQGGQTAAV